MNTVRGLAGSRTKVIPSTNVDGGWEGKHLLAESGHKTIHQAKAQRRQEDCGVGRGGQKFLPLQHSSFHSLKLRHSDGNMAELCASAAILAKSPTSAYTHLQGVAELTEFGNREKGIIYRL